MSRRPGADLLSETPSRPMSRTAILVPVYNEDVDAIFRRVRVMADSLQSVTMAGAFDIFILSDSTDPEIHHAERLEYERLREHRPVRLYNRRRAENIERQPGNIADWVRRFGGVYAQMITWEADSTNDGRPQLG